jgi:hypothetical protein
MSLSPGTPAPAGEASISRRHWLVPLCFALFSFEIGLFLVVFPWMDSWSLNYFAGIAPGLEDLWEEPAFRGAVTGLGFVNIYVAMVQLFGLFRRRQSSSTPT